MKIELMIDGEKKIFNTPFVPMLAKRKYLEIVAKAQERAEEDENYPNAQQQMDEDDEMMGILANVVFSGQFTVEQLYLGADDKYNYAKLREAVFGEKPNNEGTEKNTKGE